MSASQTQGRQDRELPVAGSGSDERTSSNARAVVVNRTHRVIRDQALSMRAQRSRSRSLWVPLGICSALLLVICYAVWSVLAGYDLTPTDVPDASEQMFLLMLWSLPVAAIALMLAWLRRSWGQPENAGDTSR